MAVELGVSYVSILPEMSKFSGIVGKQLRSAEKSASASGDAMGRKMGGSFASSLKKAVGPALAVFGAGAIAGFAKQAVGAFSELEDSTAAAGVVFGDNMKQIIAQSKTAAKDLGLTQQQVINAANTFGTYGKAAGLSGKALADFATQQTALAADMASFKGTSPEQAIEAIGAALRGETEPIRAYGVMLDDASLKAEAMKQGLISTTKDALTPQQKTLAAQALILKQTADAQGDFARTSDSTANVQKTLSATTSDVSAKLGSVLAPAFTAARKRALGVVEGVNGLLDKVLAFQSVLADDGNGFALLDSIGIAGETAARYGPVIDTFTSRVSAGFTKIRDSAGHLWAGFTLPKELADEFGDDLHPLLAFGHKVRQALDGVVQAATLFWAGLTMPASVAKEIGVPLEGLVAVGSSLRGVFDALVPAISQLGPPVLELIMALSPLGIVLKALGPILPELAAAASQLAVVVAGALTTAVQVLTPIISGVVSAVANFLSGLTSTQAGVDGLMGALVVAGGIFLTYKVATVASTVATNAHTVATKAAALGQKALNLAMKANPIMLVVSLLAGLVAGLVWFFTETETGRKVIETVWGAIQTFIGGVVEWLRTYVLPVVQKVFNAVGAVFTWLWQKVAAPVFNGIQWLVDAWWQVTSAIFNLAIVFLRAKLGPVFTWLRDSIIKPVFDFITGYFEWAWGNWQVVFGAVVGFLRNTLGPAFTWLYNNIIKPVWDNISRVISDAWNNNIKPVFDRFGQVVRAIPLAFEAARDGIGSAWSALVDLAKKPVVFVVDTVIGGLVDTFNKIPGVNITKPKLPSSFYQKPASGPAQSGRTRFFAKGGYAAPGWAVVGEEGPELVNFSKPGRVYTAKETASMLGHAAHGEAHPLMASPTGAIPTLNTGFPGIIANLGKNKAYVEDNAPGWRIPQAVDIINQMSALKLEVARRGMPRIQTYIGGAAMQPNWLAYASRNEVRFNPNGIGPHQSPTYKRAVSIHELLHVLGHGHTNAASIMQPVMQNHMLPTSYDVRAMQRLYGKGGTGVVDAPDNPFSGLVGMLMERFKKAFPGGGMFIDAAGGLAKSGIESVVKIVTDIQNGIKDLAGNIWGNIKEFFGGGSQVAGHAKGGLARGWSVVGEEGPELVNFSNPGRVYTAHQSAELARAALSDTRPSREIVINGNVGWDPSEVARRIQTEERRQRVIEGALV